MPHLIEFKAEKKYLTSAPKAESSAEDNHKAIFGEVPRVECLDDMSNLDDYAKQLEELMGKFDSLFNLSLSNLSPKPQTENTGAFLKESTQILRKIGRDVNPKRQTENAVRLNHLLTGLEEVYLLLTEVGDNKSIAAKLSELEHEIQMCGPGISSYIDKMIRSMAVVDSLDDMQENYREFLFNQFVASYKGKYSASQEIHFDKALLDFANEQGMKIPTTAHGLEDKYAFVTTEHKEAFLKYMEVEYTPEKFANYIKERVEEKIREIGFRYAINIDSNGKLTSISDEKLVLSNMPTEIVTYLAKVCGLTEGEIGAHDIFNVEMDGLRWESISQIVSQSILKIQSNSSQKTDDINENTKITYFDGYLKAASVEVTEVYGKYVEVTKLSLSEYIQSEDYEIEASLASILNENGLKDIKLDQATFDKLLNAGVTNFSGAIISNVVFNSQELKALDFSGTSFVKCEFQQSHLNQCVLSNAHFISTKFEGGTIKNCDLSQIETSEITINGTELESCTFPKKVTLSNQFYLNEMIAKGRVIELFDDFIKDQEIDDAIDPQEFIKLFKIAYENAEDKLTFFKHALNNKQAVEALMSPHPSVTAFLSNIPARDSYVCYLHCKRIGSWLDPVNFREMQKRLYEEYSRLGDKRQDIYNFVLEGIQNPDKDIRKFVIDSALYPLPAEVNQDVDFICRLVSSIDKFYFMIEKYSDSSYGHGFNDEMMQFMLKSDEVWNKLDEKSQDKMLKAAISSLGYYFNRTHYDSYALCKQFVIQHVASLPAEKSEAILSSFEDTDCKKICAEIKISLLIESESRKVTGNLKQSFKGFKSDNRAMQQLALLVFGKEIDPNKLLDGVQTAIEKILVKNDKICKKKYDDKLVKILQALPLNKDGTLDQENAFNKKLLEKINNSDVKAMLTQFNTNKHTMGGLKTKFKQGLKSSKPLEQQTTNASTIKGSGKK